MTYKEFLDQAGKNLTFKQLNDSELILYNGANGWPCAVFYPEDDAWGPYIGNVHVKGSVLLYTVGLIVKKWRQEK